MKSKILIIGPIEDLGGRELEAGFIASVLKKDFDVSVLSTGNISSKSQLYEISNGIRMTSLKQRLFEKFKFLRPATFLSYLRNNRKEPLYFYVNNQFNSRFTKPREKSILKETFERYDLIFIIAHLQTLRTKEIIEYSRQLNKPVVFRTTGEIELSAGAPAYFKNVDLFLHHSIINANNLHEKLKVKNYAIIDQNSYMEDELLKIPAVKKGAKKFVAIARLAPEKNLFNLISFFNEYAEDDDELLIVGTGKLFQELLSITEETNNIKLLGHVSLHELNKIYANSDCAIIPAYTEAGPLVGIDAMAAGKVILSTKTGAMPERLENTLNDFWFEPDDKKTFQKQFERIKNLSPSEVEEIANMNRETYLKKYSKKMISKQYLEWVTRTLKNN